MSDLPESVLGAFPRLGPVTYLPLSPDAVREALTGEYPPNRTWFHATWERSLGSILRAGLIPSCWWGGDACCVFGYDRREDIPQHRASGWILEFHSRALEDQLKAWWVPVSALRGAWRWDRFWSVDELRRQFTGSAAATTHGCYCELSELSVEQQRLWQTTWT
jgi:hypothetical protein